VGTTLLANFPDLHVRATICLQFSDLSVLEHLKGDQSRVEGIICSNNFDANSREKGLLHIRSPSFYNFKKKAMISRLHANLTTFVYFLEKNLKKYYRFSQNGLRQIFVSSLISCVVYWYRTPSTIYINLSI
jgi:hypothetical protein